MRLRKTIKYFFFPYRPNVTRLDAWMHIDEDDGSRGLGTGRRQHDPSQPLRDFGDTGLSKMCKVDKGSPKLHSSPEAPCKAYYSANAFTEETNGVLYKFVQVSFGCDKSHTRCFKDANPGS